MTVMDKLWNSVLIVFDKIWQLINKAVNYYLQSTDWLTILIIILPIFFTILTSLIYKLFKK
ncbi:MULTISPECIES: hypothetical protein [unclassified Spiroplasma]|uniref:hypothetical protein n=1 Tax=unclassified Spiroplasma TaxID=2637901 RepID=UPI00313C4244